MGLHEHAVAEALVHRAQRVDVQDRRLRSVMQPGAALAVRNDPDGRTGLDVAEPRPVRDHAVRTRHRAGPRRIAAARLAGCGERTRTTALGRDRVGRQRGRESLEHEPLRARARRDLAGVEVALRIDRQVMQALEVARFLAALAKLIEDLQALPVEHGDVRVAVVGDIEELLLRVGGERQSGRRLRRRPGSIDERLRHELPVRREDLHSPVRTVGHVDKPVVRDLDGVHRPAELPRSEAVGIERWRGATAAAWCWGGATAAAGVCTGVRATAGTSARRGRHIDGSVAERAPHPLERAGIGVEHDDPAVAVAVRDEGLVGLGPHEDVRRLVHALRVSVAFAGRPAADLQQELSLGVELEEHVVVEIPERRCDRGAAADPHVVLVVDGDAVLAVGPVVARPGPAPRVHELPRRVELQHRRRRALPAILRDCVRPVQQVDVIAAIDGHRCDMTHDPVVRQLRPRRVYLEDGDPSRRRRRRQGRLRRHRASGNNRGVGEPRDANRDSGGRGSKHQVPASEVDSHGNDREMGCERAAPAALRIMRGGARGWR